MKKIIIISITFFIVLSGKAQSAPCPLIKDTFCYIRISIWQDHQYPIFMNGISKKMNFDSLDLRDINTFFESFYTNAYYTPDFPNGLYSPFLTCLGDSLGRKHFDDLKKYSVNVINTIKKNSTSKRIKLKTGETVNCNTVNISGSFWIIEKSNNAVSTNSNEFPIKDIKSILNCYVPCQITVLKTKSNKK